MYDYQKVLDILEPEVSYIEKKSNNNLDDKTANAGNKNFTKYARDLDNVPGFFNGKKNGYPWCAVFVCWGFYKAFGLDKARKLLNLPKNSLGAGCPYLARYFRSKGQTHKKNPQKGDLIFFGKIGKETHVGIVRGVDKKYVYTEEGNTSGASGVVANGGMVCFKKYPLNSSSIAEYARPEDKDGVNNTAANAYPTLSKGDSGDAVKTLQNRLILHGYSLPTYGADGDFGGETDTALREFQRDKGLKADGVCGEQTWKALNAEVKAAEAKAEYTLKQFVKDVQAACGADVDGIAGKETISKTVTLSEDKNASHAAVKAVQKRLNALGYDEVGKADGKAGPKFTAAVKHYQEDNGCTVDGEITAKNKTWRKLLEMK